jgi:hypothetical protein
VLVSDGAFAQGEQALHQRSQLGAGAGDAAL